MLTTQPSLKATRLRSGDKVAVVAPASAFPREEFDKGIAELRRLGFEPVFEESVFARAQYVAGDGRMRADAFLRAWRDPSIAALIAQPAMMPSTRAIRM